MKGKQFISLIILLVVVSYGYGQKKRTLSKNTPGKNLSALLKGQWKGGFNDDVLTFSSLGEDNTAYVLELNVDGNRINGSSYTYFNIGGRKYYSICRIEGTYNSASEELVVKEVERIKANTPPPPIFTGCLQIHRLKIVPQGNGTYELIGTWESVPGQMSGCESSGSTTLRKRMLSNPPLGIKSPQRETVKRSSPKKTSPVPTPKPQKQPTPKVKEEPEETDRVVVKTEEKKVLEKIEMPFQTIMSDKKFEVRRNDVVKTIQIIEPKFQLEFYDNGEIDGDSISVFYNGKLVLSNQRLSDKPVSLTLPIDKNSRENIVTMYADNLGTIPPNTAVMIVRDGNRTYEVRLESDLKKSASVIFVPKD